MLLKHLKINRRLLEVLDFLADGIIPVREGLALPLGCGVKFIVC